MILDLLHLEAQMREARDRLGAALGVTGPAYAILMTIGRYQASDSVEVGDGIDGVRVREVAAKLHVTGAFVTGEANKLVIAGLVEKRPDPGDRRGVRLCLTATALAQIEALAPRIRAVNDYFFGDLSRAEFDALSRLGARLGNRTAAAFFEVFQPAA
jgi:DNA-binding MarR family transcriptional regulator